MGNARTFFSKEDQDLIRAAIAAAEQRTSGEIRVHIDDTCNEDVMDRAAYWFEALDMHQTEQRNGILFYLAFQDHKFALLGDAGIHAKVPEGFWDGVRDVVLGHFREGNFTEGLCAGIQQAGEQLQAHFPYQQDDTNELSDDVSFGGAHDA